MEYVQIVHITGVILLIISFVLMVLFQNSSSDTERRLGLRPFPGEENYPVVFTCSFIVFIFSALMIVFGPAFIALF